MKMSLDKKILAGFIVCAMVLAIVAATSFRNSRQFTETSMLVTHTHEVLYEIEQVLLHTVNAESGARGYSVTGDPRQLDPYNESRNKIASHVQHLRELTRDNPQQQANIADLERLLTPRLANLDKQVELSQGSDLEAARKLIASGEGQRLQDAIRLVLDNARRIEQSLLTTRSDASQQEGESFTRFFIILLGIIVLTLGVVYFIIIVNLKALRRAETEAAEKNWNLTGNAELARKMQGNLQVRELSQAIITQLVSYLEMQTGLLYVADDDGKTFRPMGVYAYDNTKLVNVKLGEGLAGQCAAQQATIFVKDIQDDSYVVNTGFGKVRPKSIIALPLIFESQVIGIITVGAVHNVRESAIRFLEVAASNIAIGITSAQAREKSRELLEETQRQAEELEVQQEELRQANDELHAKTELLGRSELELKAQQEELQQVNTELEEKANMLEEQKGVLEGANDEIEKKAAEVELTSKYKSEFLANMSHELRTPLNSILILAQLLSENKHNRLGDKEVEYAGNIHKSGNDLLNLINEILDLSKIEAGKMELDIDEVPVEKLTSSISSMFREIASSRGIRFDIKNRKEDRFVLTTDAQRVDQILRNLLSNAFKFTAKGGAVTLSVGAPQADIIFRNKSLNSASSVIAFAVSDSGIGIPPEKRDIIFEAFQQADGSTKRKYGGTGLGLSISRQLAYALGGEIHLQSEVGKGSTFTLFLPSRFEASQSNEREHSNGKEPESPRKPPSSKSAINEFTAPAPIADDRNDLKEKDRVVLIVEDEVPFASLLLDFVRSRQYKGVVATQGNMGLSFARQYKPDAILLDIKLPVMDGTEVLKQLKNDPQLRHIPVQIISSYDRRKEGLALGAFDYSVKPISRQDLDKTFDNLETFSNKKFKKLLIIEDDPQQNTAICELIGGGDVKCFSAFTGADAHNLLKKEQFDCVILDLGLPDMSGFDLLEKIKSDAQLNRTPIIIYTGKELAKSDAAKLQTLADKVVLKTANSHERLLDETTLFLHRVETKLPKEKQRLIRTLHNTDEVLKGKTILLADDDIRNIYSLANVFEDEGIICLTAENGRIAIQSLHDNPSISLVLMDVMMPEMDGYEATMEIRKLPQYSKLPIIALTAKAMKGDREKCLAAGMSDYVSKPVDIEQLLSLMRVWLYK